jgi:hypothetical protein
VLFRSRRALFIREDVLHSPGPRARARAVLGHQFIHCVVDHHVVDDPVDLDGDSLPRPVVHGGHGPAAVYVGRPTLAIVGVILILLPPEFLICLHVARVVVVTPDVKRLVSLLICPSSTAT